MSFYTRIILLILSVIGPGFVTATADNDASGIATYAMVGSMFGYKMLWGLFLITISGVNVIYTIINSVSYHLYC